MAQRESYASLFENVLAQLVRKTSDVRAARLLLTRDPYDEHAYGTLIESEVQARRFTAARELFGRYRAAMKEAGIDPSLDLAMRFSSDAERDAGFKLPFVARESELGIIDRRLYVTMVLGEPGIGKSALLARAAEIARQKGIASFTVRGREDSSTAVVWASLYHDVTEGSLERAIAAAADVPTSIASEIARKFQRPTLLFIDDAHALRGDALATLVELARRTRDGSFVLVVAMRPEGLSGVGLLLSPYIDERLELGPLRREDVDSALALTLTNASADLNAALFARSGGHPLFLVSLLESLVRDRTLDRDRGRWRITRDLTAQLQLPQDLRASIDARLRAAGDEAAVVACGLALEPSATADDLAAALGYDEPAVLDALDRLLGFALIREDPHHHRFYFLHDVVREVAAALLNAGRRVALHREFARRYGRDLNLEGGSRMARHLKAAGMMPQAARAYEHAAQAAIDRYAFHDALQFCADGAVCLGRLPPSREVHVVRARLKALVTEAALQTGAFDLASSAVDDAVRAARTADEPEAIAQALVLRASLRGIVENSPQRLTDAQEALRLSIQTANASRSARARVQLSAVARAGGNFDDAVKFAIEAAASAVASKERAIEYDAIEELLRAHISWLRFSDAFETIQRAGSIAEAAGVAAQARLACTAAWLYCSAERFDEAHRFLTEADFLITQLAERRDPVPPDAASPLLVVRFSAHYLCGLVAFAQERFDDALAAVDECRRVVPLASLPPYRDAAAKLALCVGVKTGAVIRPNDEPTTDLPSSLLFTTDSSQLWRACVAARRTATKRLELRAALDDLEERAKRMPLDCDRAFAVLGHAAGEGGEPAIAARAEARRAHYYAARIAAAAAQRSMRPRVSSGSMSRPSA